MPSPGRAPKRAILERETGFEPATSTLARSHSTAELLPLVPAIITKAGCRRQGEGCREKDAGFGSLLPARCLLPPDSPAMPAGFPLQLGVFPGSDVVAQVPKLLVKH